MLDNLSIDYCLREVISNSVRYASPCYSALISCVTKFQRLNMQPKFYTVIQCADP
jgi:hypothetical protein